MTELMSHDSSGAAAPESSLVLPLPSSVAHAAPAGPIAGARRRPSDGAVAAGDGLADGAPVSGSGGATRQSVTPPEPAASTDTQPFLRQRRLPSILLDTWEFRKLAAEGSVLANAMVSYDVDGDGLEEVILGTTEGLLCVVKPDCREPLFLRVVAATISVVLYAPIQSRLVLITLEGHCEVIDHFLKLTQQPQHRAGSEPASMSTASPADGGDGGAASAGGQPYQQADSANSLPLTSASLNGGNRSAGGARGSGATASSHSTGRSPSAEAAMPTKVFHIPSNCLCADLSPERDADLVFLGSYDRRFYVYSIINGSCLLSLFLHDPITSVKAFTIPTSTADAHLATTSSHIPVYNKRASTQASRCGRSSGSQRTRASSSDGSGALGMPDDSPQEVETMPDRLTKASASSSIPLVFASTPTHLILLPGGLSDIQRWRKLQPKSAHFPLAVQLHSDYPAPTVHPSQQSQPPQTQHEHSGRHSSLDSGGATNVRATLWTPAAVRHRSDDDHPLEGESTVPHPMTGTPLTSSPALRPPLSMPADAGLGGGLEGDTSGGQASSHLRRRGGATTEHWRDSAGVLTGGAQHNSGASVSVATVPAPVAAGVAAGVSLSRSQLRRQASRRAIQAAEMGLPVLVKPLWALRIGSHALDVPLLQTMLSSDGGMGGGFVSAVATAGGLQPSSVTGAIVQEASVVTAAGTTSSRQSYRGRPSFITPVHSSSGGTMVGQLAMSSSVFSVSPPSSVLALHEGAAVSSSICNSAVLRSGTLAPSSLADSVAASPELWHPHGSGLSPEGGEGTVDSYATPTVSAMGVEAEQIIRRSNLHIQFNPPPPRLWQGTPNNSSDDDSQVVGVRRSSSGDDDDDDDAVLLGDEEAFSFVEGAALVMNTDDIADGEQKEDDIGNADYGTATDEDFGFDQPGASTSSVYRSGSDASGRSSNGEVDEAIANGGHHKLTSSLTCHTRHHHGTDAVGPPLLACNLLHKRAESAPTMLLRGTRIASEARNGCGGGLLKTATTTAAVAHLSLLDVAELDCKRCAHRLHRSAAERSRGERGGRGSSRNRHPQASASREHYAQQHHSAYITSPPLGAAASPPHSAEVRLPTSVDVSVGASQVAVAVSCEDGLALELRFSIVRLASLSRSERRLPRGTVRLYDTRKPRRKGGSKVTYNIFLPTSTARKAGTAAALAPLTHRSGSSLASSHQRQYSRSCRHGCRGAGGAPPTTTLMNTPAGDSVASAMGALLATDDTGCSASASTNYPLGNTTDDPAMVDADGEASRNSCGALVPHYGEDAIVLRAQCLWAARLSDSPLVQRARVLCVRDRHPDETFCSVFVAANGTCFVANGGTLSIVECCVNEDCSSFTLITAPFSVTPTLPTRANVVTIREAAANTPALAQDGTVNGASAAAMSLNLLRGMVRHTVSCVCVSVDELSVYSFGEANQLWRHPDCSSSTSVPPGTNEPISPLSRCLPNNNCAPVTGTVNAPTGQTAQGMAVTAACALPSTDFEEEVLLRQLAMRLRQHEQHARPPFHHNRGRGAGAASEGEHAVEMDEEVVIRMKEMLLYDYSEQEWEKLQWLEHAST
ncbi:Quinonprotein alcohol dehydrogenase-like protein, putative [Leishmania guyanensis]|uniref:Uncharacterized protein n=1 Tax=Leishmania guyanensis TaxID=5670 RepID=A0A1E1IVB8_LEIGU|nr:hypothetical protein, conserved [Leishmania guyanensis]